MNLKFKQTQEEWFAERRVKGRHFTCRLWRTDGGSWHWKVGLHAGGWMYSGSAKTKAQARGACQQSFDEVVAEMAKRGTEG